MNLKTTHLKQATVLTVVGVLVLCQSFVTGTPLTQVVSKLQSYVTGANSVKSLRLPSSAQLSTQGTVMLNGNAAPTGATVLSGSGVKTIENGSAVLSFGALGQVELTGATDFTLAVEGSTLGGQLRAGSATIVAAAGVAVKVVTADGPVVTDGKEAVVLTVDVTGGKTRVETSGSLASVSTPAGVTPVPTNQARRIRIPSDQLQRINESLAQIRRAAETINQKGGTINMADVDTLEAAARRGDRAGFDAALKRILATKPSTQTSQQNIEPAESVADNQKQHGPYSPPPSQFGTLDLSQLFQEIRNQGNLINNIISSIDINDIPDQNNNNQNSGQQNNGQQNGGNSNVRDVLTVAGSMAGGAVGGIIAGELTSSPTPTPAPSASPVSPFR